MKLLFILMLILACFFMHIGCRTNPGPDDEDEYILSFNPEYDYVTDCDIFPGSDGDYNYDYVGNVFAEANTVFMPYIGNDCVVQESGEFGNSEADMYAFLARNADTYENGDLVNHSYIAGVKSISVTGYLGYYLDGGIDGKAACFIFMDHIQADANAYDIDSIKLRKGAVIHELGHLRAGLTHLCNGIIVDYDNHDYPDDWLTCIMTNGFPTGNCYEPGNKKPLDNMGFCTKCINKLIKVDW